MGLILSKDSLGNKMLEKAGFSMKEPLWRGRLPEDYEQWFDSYHRVDINLNNGEVKYDNIDINPKFVKALYFKLKELDSYFNYYEKEKEEIEDLDNLGLARPIDRDCDFE